ncbi:uncharacterized protein ColSpa_05189 [Colletotrichum spaethianum]|uniref:DUF7726 domain-containing protein n=1 Tax=Colletotrichum spaethianum TaxID=700344 RepID=A0AA37P1L0_9PEZI|nr:uncharacterized protein ColSpa_05189 [Colletotrichum spaethianum]GKT45008.1 hypothetical protein ColSpa_05189 [Colletotrichum spaethianum]
MPPKKAAAAAAADPAPLGDADANRVSASNNTITEPAEKPAPKSRKRKSDAADAAADTAEPAPKKQATKKKDDPLPDLSEIHLDGDEHMNVPVYDTCDTVRTKIRALLKKDGVTKAAFLRATVKAAYGADSTHKVAPNLLTNFLNKKGAGAGNTSSVFYAAYVFFEKLRIRDKKPKGKKREEMEREWPNGMETKEQLGGPVFAHVSESVSMDKYGKTVISGPRGVMRG